jgi:putative ABC transport system permease protein
MSPENLLTFRVSLPGSKYREAPRRIAFFSQAAEQLSALPGVQSVSAISFLPFTGMAAGTWVRIAGRPAPRPGEELLTVVRTVLPNYFRTMGIPLLEGRDFTAADNAPAAPHRFIINRAFARKYLSGEQPLSQSISVLMDRENPYGQIIGVVGDVREGSLDKEPEPTVYYNHGHLTYSGMTFAVRTGSRPLALAGSIRRVIQGLDPDQPIAELRTMDEVLAETVSRQRFSALLLVVFAAVALALAAIGIYGILSYAVTERTSEIGVRMALGAQSRHVLSLVLGQGFRLVAAGLLAGTATAVVLTRLLSGLLFGVRPTDPATFISVAALLMVVAMLATYLPARRAALTSPIRALRYE